MYRSLLSPAKLAAGITAFSVVFSLSSTTLTSPATPVVSRVETPDILDNSLPQPGEAIELEKPLIAHHGAEGTNITAATLVTNTNAKGSLSESLWANLVLTMAYQRDPEIQRLVQKCGRANNLLLLSIFGVSGLGLAQNITTLSTLNSGHNDAGGDADHHDSGHKDSSTPSILGIVGSSVSLASLAGQTYLTRRYQRKIAARQEILKSNIESILGTLAANGNIDAAQSALTPYIGEQASQEFIQLWQSSHPATP